MTHIFVLVDDWLQSQAPSHGRNRPGVRAQFSDSEVLTLALLMDYLPFPGETQFLGFIRANYLEYFPRLLEQSQFNRRLRTLSERLEHLRRHWVMELLPEHEQYFLVDTKPLPVLGLKRDKRRSDFAGNAAPGYCASRQMYYFGYKLTLLSSWDGLPIAYDLVPADTDERFAVESVLDTVRGATIYGDKGFIGEEWQAQIEARSGDRLWTVKRINQSQQHSPELNGLITRVRQRVEGVFHELQNTGRNPERVLSKTIDGFCLQIAAKMASHTLRRLLKQKFDVDVLTFQYLKS